MITQECLERVLNYHKETGVFRWRTGRGGRRKNKIAGFLRKDGYREISVGGKLYGAHRLAWLYCKGEFPKNQIDHINHKPDDNRISNLRDVTQAENQQNVLLRVDNKSGYSGLRLNSAGRWVVALRKNKERFYIGSFNTKELAIRELKKARKEIGFHRNHGVSRELLETKIIKQQNGK